MDASSTDAWSQGGEPPLSVPVPPEPPVEPGEAPGVAPPLSVPIPPETPKRDDEPGHAEPPLSVPVRERD